MIFRTFAEGGPMMYLILLLAVVGLVTALIGFAAHDRRAQAVCGGATLVLGILCGIAGALGYWWGMSRMEAALVHVEPSVREQLLAVGTHEASHNWKFGGAAGVLLVICGVIVTARARAAEGRDPALPPQA